MSRAHCHFNRPARPFQPSFYISEGADYRGRTLNIVDPEWKSEGSCRTFIKVVHSYLIISAQKYSWNGGEG